jgi:hypothetical protein
VKKSKHPRLRAKTYKGAGGQVWVYYTMDMRGTGKPDIRLGTDYTQAVRKWTEITQHIPMTIGRVQQSIDKWRAEVLPTYTSTNTRAQYKSYLLCVESAFGQMGWDEINMQTLYTYIEKRSAKTSANRETAVLALVWNAARRWGMTEKQYPAQGLGKWKNKEQTRKIDVTTDLFDAVYEQADRILRDAMDIATSTGMRITDVRTIRMPLNGVLRFAASKTGKLAEFDVAQSPVLTELVGRRLAMRAHSVMLLASNTGRQVSEWMLSERWTAAKAKAIAAHPELTEPITKLFLRDLRKRAANLATDVEAASKLLQHSDLKTTHDHYFFKAAKLTAVR